MIRHKKTFESWLPALFDGEFKWDFLLPAWSGTKIQPMDLDAIIERRNHFLIFETKKPGKGIDVGQRITLTNLWRNGRSTIIFLSGKQPEEITGYCMYGEWEKDKNADIGSRDLTSADAYDVIFLVRKWFCWASGDDVPDREDWDRELWLWEYNGGKHAG